MSKSYDGILVLGAPRSGTTLMRRLLNAHPQICCPPETSLFSAAARFLEEESFAGGMSVGVIPGLNFSGFERLDVLQRLREFVFDFLRDIVQRSGRKRWAEKTAFDIFYLDQIKELCGDRCLYICLFRHGLDVVCSMKELCDKMEMYPAELHPYIRRHMAPMEALAHAWADTNENLLRLTVDRPDQCIKVQYEQLVDDPHTHLGEIFDFLGEPTDVKTLIRSAMRSTDKVGLGDWKTYQSTKVHATSVARWKKLSEETVVRLAPILNPVMSSIGYGAIPVNQASSVTAEEYQHRYELSLVAARLAAERRPNQEPSHDA